MRRLLFLVLGVLGCASAKPQVVPLKWPVRLPCDRFVKLQLSSLDEMAVSWTGATGKHSVKLSNPTVSPEGIGTLSEVRQPDFPVGLESVRVTPSPDSLTMILECRESDIYPGIRWWYPRTEVCFQVEPSRLPAPLAKSASDADVRDHMRSVLELACSVGSCSLLVEGALMTLAAGDTPEAKLEPIDSCRGARIPPASSKCSVGDIVDFHTARVRIVRTGSEMPIACLENDAIRYR
jgi:hypothetical protein